MENRNSTIFTISWVIALVAAILYSITIIGLIIGIPLFIASGKFKDFSKQTDEEIINNKTNVIVWGVICAIFTFPVGLIALIPAFNTEGEAAEFVSNTGNKVKQGYKNATKDKLTEELEKLAELKEKGLIDEDEYKQAKMKLLTK